MRILHTYIPLIFAMSFVPSVGVIGSEVYTGNGGEPSGADEFIVYPGMSSDIIEYRLGQKRHFYIRYNENIDPETFSADLNGKDISRKFHPVPGSEEDVFLHLKPGENELNIQIAGHYFSESGETTSAGDLDVFTIKLNPPLLKANMLTTPPPGIDVLELPPSAADNSRRPVFIIKTQEN